VPAGDATASDERETDFAIFDYVFGHWFEGEECNVR
jgi:hypothetical protein